jgi:hypothetical protein
VAALLGSYAWQNYRPTALPAGFVLRRELAGPSACAFRDSPDQIALIYTTGWTPSEFRTHLFVALDGLPATPLVGTELREGDLIPSAEGDAVYHDGMWAPGPGEDQRDIGPVAIHWERSTFHSVLIATKNCVVAVRALKQQLGQAQLLETARSVTG